MYPKSWKISDYKHLIECLYKKIEKLESGVRGQELVQQCFNEIKKLQRENKQLKKELAETHTRHVDTIDNFIEAGEDLVKEKDKEISREKRATKAAMDRAFRAEHDRDHWKDMYMAEKKDNDLLRAENQELKDQVGKLTVRIKKDHTNSSKPSSSDPNHKKIPNSRKPTGRKPGAQKGHEHHPRKPLEPDETVEIATPEEFKNPDLYVETGRTISKQLICLEVSAYVTEYIAKEYRNRRTGQRVHADFPKGVVDDVNYDGSVKAAAYMLNNKYNVSIGGTCDFLKQISGGKINLSTGMVCNLSREFSDKTQKERNDIFLNLVVSPQMHADFTFGRVNGKQAAIIICATPDKTLYQAREKKGYEGVKDSPVEVYHGTLISDHESTFKNYGEKHQECMAHVLRYLKSSIENEPELSWNKEMFELIQTAIHYNNNWQDNDIPDWKFVAELVAQYDRILKIAEEEYKNNPPNKYFKDGYNLYKRMKEDKDDYLLFLYDKDVEPTNNLAERNARKVKRKMVVTTAYRSLKGLSLYCDGLSVIQTLSAEGKNLNEEITIIFNRPRGARA